MDDTQQPAEPAASEGVSATPLRLNAAAMKRGNGKNAIQITFTLLVELDQAAQFADLIRQLATIAGSGLEIASPSLPRQVPPAEGNGGLRIIRP